MNNTYKHAAEIDKRIELAKSLVMFLLGSIAGLAILITLYFGAPMFKTMFALLLAILTVILITQGVFTLSWMLYAWENPEETKKHKSPKEYASPQYSFTALIPARHEEQVIKDTIKAVNNISYPQALKEVIVLCKSDDIATIARAQEVIQEIGEENSSVKVHIFDGNIASKPHALNEGLRISKNEIVTIFDAEDEPHPDIYNVINTILIHRNVDIIQSGVQLMNYTSHWFSALNCLEYFFWFKSGLHFFTNVCSTTPLGGNTVFFKKDILNKIGGWDEDCLTEDADIGFRLVAAGAKAQIVYDEQHVTKEETPSTISDFIKQRTRWNQGFMQVFLKGDWRQFPTFKQKVTALYVLLTPELQALLLAYTPVAFVLSFIVKVPVLLSLVSFIPLFLFFLQAVMLVVGLYEFTKAYNLRFRIWMILQLLLAFYPYQFILMFSSFRALRRQLSQVTGWEKTLHLNDHRKHAYA